MRAHAAAAALVVTVLVLVLAPTAASAPLALPGPKPTAASLPKPPAGAVKLGVAPVGYCGPGASVYEEVWDVNPQTLAAFAYYGKAVPGPDGRPSFEPPVAARLDDDEGRGKFYSLEGGRLVERSLEDFSARYGNQWCEVIR